MRSIDMIIRKVFLTLSCLTAAGCLVIGTNPQYRAMSAALVLLPAVLWVIKPVRQFAWAASINLGVYLCAAAANMIGGGIAIWLVIGGMAALAGWDLVSCGQSIVGSEQNDGLRRWEKEHLKMLAFMLGLSVILLMPFLFVHIKIQFAMMFGALAAAFAGLLLASHIIHKNNTP